MISHEFNSTTKHTGNVVKFKNNPCCIFDLKYLIHGASLAKMRNGINQGGDLLIALIEATCNSFETSLMNGNSPDRYFASVLLKQFGISKIDRETIDNIRDLARLLKEERCIPKVVRTDLPDAFEARSEDYWGRTIDNLKEEHLRIFQCRGRRLRPLRS